MSPSSCAKCRKPETVLTPGGLCPECAATAATAEPTSAAPPPPASATRAFAPTVSHAPPPADESPTRSAAPVVDTIAAPEGRPTPLPHSPPGYELIRLLGEGGMGDVYLAQEVPADRLVALKFLRCPGHLAGFQRFVTELQTLAKLDHANIVRVFASDFLRADPFFAMEHLAGGSLSHAIKAAPPAVAEAVRIIRVIAAAVAAAHAAQVVHRDLKPNNILLAADGTLKVADFGLAKLLDEADGPTHTTATLGTPGYMPPEQISRKNGAIGTWSDVYGLGATLYHLLTGRAPFVGGTPEEIIPQVLADEPPRPRALRPEIPLALEGIVVKCLAKDPTERYQTVAAFLADLDNYEAKRKPVAPPLTRVRRTKLWAKQNRRSLGAVGVAVAVVVGAFVLGGALRPKPLEAPDPRDEIRKELRAGNEVELVEPSGEMRWHRWRVGGGTFGKAAPGDGVMFETIDWALLELLDDPGIDRYTIRVKIRQTRPLGGANLPNRRRDEDVVGVYFGHADLSAANPPTHAFFAVWFGDFDPAAGPLGPVTDQPVSLMRVLRTLGPQDKPYQHPTAFAQRLFTPVVRRPGEWRSVEVEVTPGELRARWLGVDNQWKPLKGLPPMVPGDKFALLQHDLDGVRPECGIVLPPWSPRSPLGIYAHASALEIGSVTITPHPAP